MQEAAGTPMKYSVMKVENPYKFFISTFLGKQALKALKAETVCMLWNSIFNYAVNRLDHRDRDAVNLARAIQRNGYWTILKKENVAYGEAPGAMDVWLGWFAVLLEIEQVYPNYLGLLKVAVVFIAHTKFPA